uniref:Guanylate cyclase domain-containing protein n=2 Tax=Rhizochromulina marina TaxID=1034831 RepID=A0A7S2WTU2_9STRA|mmetsp:Transcript_33278/g.96432  ORF Transcript_33278/g.96432 Transcript_33278/m.96432 type:complete len:852 (+) Transcript_33278:158-2713(+)|eukprot:CAMPEP_0118977804 /NCGR_PEP_ID=MMETSP1173-20130426/22312_1 /TAXON_ID=1034831 /ORGANISM="Rhizochromulina marina cf, Strain CCMP1243" /LENGTH=851 /DNA_ID=CAMNT_0006927953 /DNA_START=111 /DNA_END=2666 /DNA_ORIENTATION=-
MSRRRTKSVTGAASSAADMILQRGRASTSGPMSTTPVLSKRKKHLRVKIIPDTVKTSAAISELREVKRGRVIGQKWNSATIFSVMWALYIIGLLFYFADDPNLCRGWFVFFILRLVLLVPTVSLAILWHRGWWPDCAPDPEWLGVVFAIYISVVVTLKFCTDSNVNCDGKFESGISELDVRVTLTDASGLSNLTMQLDDSECTTYTGWEEGIKMSVGDCDFEFLDVRTQFEINVYAWIGQLILYLFAFTSLFKPSLSATLVYNFLMILIVALGCFLQGASFWFDPERVSGAEIMQAIFVFMCAVLTNTYSAYVLYNMERDLVHANYELNASMAKRQKAPSGGQVVYLETDLQSSTKLWDQHTQVMHTAIKIHHALMRTLALEYFGWELATEGDAFLLSFHDVFDAVSMALTFQAEMMEQDWPEELLKDPDAGEVMVDNEGSIEASKGQREAPRPRVSTIPGRTRSLTRNYGDSLLAFKGPRVRMAIHMGDGTQGVKGKTARFVHQLTDLAWGGMIVMSNPAAQVLLGVLEQLDHGAKGHEDVSKPKLVAMGTHTFDECDEPMELYHIYTEPLRGRHYKWGEEELKLRDSVQHTLGFYDAPVHRETLAECATIMFGDISHSQALRRYDPEAFAEGLTIVNQTVLSLLMIHRGYQVPQRDNSHFMLVFHTPVDGSRFHASLQMALLDVDWPNELLDLPDYLRPDFNVGRHGHGRPSITKGNSGAKSPKMRKSQLYRGLCVSFGLAVGYVTKELEAGRANYLGPTCNRAARISSLAKCGQLLMSEPEFQHDRASLYTTSPPDGSPRYPITGHMLYANQNLKGISGAVNIVWLDTCEVAKLRQTELSNKAIGTAL